MYRSFLKNCFLFALGGGVFYLLEVCWREYSHLSMFIVGGICFILIGEINQHILTWDMPLLLQMVIATLIVTGIELISGLILNVWLGMGIWDYRHLPGNLWGQICPQFTAVWFLLSAGAIVLDDYIRYRFFGEMKPRYKLI